MTDLPSFRYHPDPLATGSVVLSETVCACCGQARGAVYAGPVYAEEELDRQLCPWCIADGSAAAKFEAVFVDSDGVGDYGCLSPVPDDVVEEISQRTPGFTAWQQETWWTHCNDGGAFLGPAGKAELDEMGDEAWTAVRTATGFEGEEWQAFASQVSRNGNPTAYLFRCLHCGQLGATWDCA